MQAQTISVRSLAGAQEGRTWQSDRQLQVGRLPASEVALDDASVSRQHAEVAFTSKGWVVRDLGSTNGTFLNGSRVGRAEHNVRKGDILQFGDIAMIVDIAPTSPREETTSSETKPREVVPLKAAWEDVPGVVDAISKEGDFYKNPIVTLIQTGRDFYRFTCMEDYLHAILWEAAETTNSQQGAILLRDEMTGALGRRAVFALGASPAREAWLGDPLAKRALDEKTSLLWQAAGPVEAGDKGSAIYALLRSPREQLGVLCLAREAGQPPLEHAALQFADTLAFGVSASIDSLGHMLEKQRTMFLQTLSALTQVVEMRGGAIYGQSQRVTDYALLIAEELKLPDADCQLLRIGVPLRDLGKIAVADGLLQKPGALTAEERRLMRAQILKGIALLETIPGLAIVMPLVRSHREHWDGKGYPDGLEGIVIPLLARIVAVAETFEALTTDRPYRRALALDEVFAEIQRQAGGQFDPECVQALLRLRERIEKLLQDRKQSTSTLSRDAIRDVVGSLGPGSRPPLNKPARASRSGLSA
jgi:HD-GYP domain-containing protein (c-di-GMP phosphodiesterase class II)